MVDRKKLIGKTLYGLLFCALVPGLLIWWATELIIALPLDPSLRLTGKMLTVTGIVLMAEAMWRLWKNGKGLPMNAFPPTQYVHQGSYQLFYHPIYVGFCFTVAGISALLLSPSGLFVITPVTFLLCCSLVLGYENISLRARFGTPEHSTFFGLKKNLKQKADLKSKFGVFFSTFVPWLVLYKLVIFPGTDASYFNNMTAVEMRWPVVEIFEIPYALTYILVGLTPFIIPAQNQLRNFQLTAWWIVASGIFLQLILPFYAQHKPFEPQTWPGEMIIAERTYDGISGAFPSFHALWALLFASTWTQCFPRFKFLWWTVSALIIISCMAIGVHSTADVLSSIVLFFILHNRISLWLWVNKKSERLANSWREWHLGNFRIINHSVYAGLAGFIGILIVFQFSVSPTIIIITTISALIGGALWGQFIEGSPKLLRPFGYYGALIGGMISLILCGLAFHQPILLHASAIALAAPWVQAIGRLRCLVQGCCHGRKCEAANGIIYANKHSRVCQTDLAGLPVYNTQLFSIALNVLIGIILTRIWYAGMSPAFLTGAYFILSGAARFVEEAYRGEQQTKIVGGLRLYQWLAIVSVLFGIVITVIQTNKPLILNPTFETGLVTGAFAAALCWAFGMGMDFPKSTIRFSRLSG